MTRTKTSKVIAIVLAIAMAFAFMSFSLTYVSAEDNAPAAAQEETPKTEEESPKAQEKTPKTEEETPKAEEETPKTPTAPRPTFSFSDNTYGAPDVYVTIDFGNLEPEIDYNTAAKNPTSQDISVVEILSKILSNIKVYKNYDENADEAKKFTNEVNFGAKYKNLTYDTTKHIVNFTVPLNQSTSLSANSTYYLWLGPALNETKDADNGSVNFVKITTKNTTTSTRSTSNNTIRTTYRTITTRNSTVRARSANTDDPNHLPVWIGLAAVAALMLGAVYFTKEKE